jgi:hypothetical protein
MLPLELLDRLVSTGTVLFKDSLIANCHYASFVDRLLCSPHGVRYAAETIDKQISSRAGRPRSTSLACDGGDEFEFPTGQLPPSSPAEDSL